MKKILAYRFSALGDVAMTALVFREFLEQNPDCQIIMVSRKNCGAFFDNIPNLIFYGINAEDYKGVFGMYRLAKELQKKFKPNYVADLHDVIRTKILDRIFKRFGLPVAVIDKGKEEKEQLTDVWNLDKKQLKTTPERYADVMRKLGFSIVLSHKYRQKNVNKEGIGFAPFAQHKGKVLPLEKSFELAQILAAKNKIYFFGGGKLEEEILNSWEKSIPNSTNLAGKLSMKEEMEKIAALEVMISMDSANMHIASLCGTRCISVWGSTHPFAGFMGYGQNMNDAIQVKDLSCRPCSVFGDKECYRGDWACLNEIEIRKIAEKI